MLGIPHSTKLGNPWIDIKVRFLIVAKGLNSLYFYKVFRLVGIGYYRVGWPG
jgi:hypothetical protein